MCRNFSRIYGQESLSALKLSDSNKQWLILKLGSSPDQKFEKISCTQIACGRKYRKNVLSRKCPVLQYLDIID